MTHLRIVKPEAPKPRRARGHQLTDEEVKRVRAATGNLIRAYGSVECVSAVTGLAVDTLYEIGNLRSGRPGMASAVKIARAAGMPVEKLLSGRLSEAGACPTCSAPARRVA
jgi:hypothetical protein